MLKQSLILLSLLGSFVSVHTAAQPTREPTSFTKAVAAIKLKPKWQQIVIDKEEPNSYRLSLHYKQTAVVSRGDVMVDTKEIARAALAELVRGGKDPAKDWTSLTVWAQQGVKGETGKSLVRLFGKTSYDFNSDQLEYLPYRR